MSMLIWTVIMLMMKVMTVILMITVMLKLMQKRDSSSLSASSLQKWQAAPLCNGKFKVIKLGTGNKKFYLSVFLFDWELS